MTSSKSPRLQRESNAGRSQAASPSAAVPDRGGDGGGRSQQGGLTGRGECVPYPRLWRDPGSDVGRPAVECRAPLCTRVRRQALQAAMPPAPPATRWTARSWTSRPKTSRSGASGTCSGVRPWPALRLHISLGSRSDGAETAKAARPPLLRSSSAATGDGKRIAACASGSRI